MTDWSEYLVALIVFLAAHSLPVRPAVRRRLVARLGSRGFTVVYAGLSLLLLAWLIDAAAGAPVVALWPWAPWQPLVPLIAMLPACLIAALSLGRPNPFSFGGAGDASFDPARPGLVRLTRHPLLLALALWAGAHVPPNGDLAHALLFALFGGFALLGMRVIDKRKRRQMGDAWSQLLARSRAAPRAAALTSIPAMPLRLAAGVGAYLGLIALHPWLFGVQPLPW